MSFLHMFISEVYEASWARHSHERMWIPNEISEKKSNVRDLQGRCIPKREFVSLFFADAANLVNIGVPSLTSVWATGSCDDNCFNFEGAFYPICPLQESFCLELYSFTDEVLKVFIADSVMPLVIRDRGSIFDASRFRNTSAAVRSFADCSTALS